VGVIVRSRNPFDSNKEILVLAGRRTRGTEAAVLAFTRHIDEVIRGNESDHEKIAKVVQGLDKNGDGMIDSVEFEE
jgi:hypothetical protein